MSRYLSAAAAIALAESGVTIRGDLREAAGLIVGCREVSPASLGEFHGSILDRGLAKLSATAFARIVMNAPAGFCAKLLALRGPNLTLSAGSESGLAAIIAGAVVLAGDPDTRVMVAGGMEELGPSSTPEVGEGAGCVVLTTHPGGAVEVAGWSLQGPGRGREAAAEVLAGRDRAPGSREVLFSDATGGDLQELIELTGPGYSLVDYSPWARQAPAAGSVWAFAEAVRVIRAGDYRRALIVSSSGQSCAAAILLNATE